MTAGVVAGAAALLAFLTLHALWILPIWFIAPVAAPLALLTGAAAGWAGREIEATCRLPGPVVLRGPLLAAALLLAQAPTAGLAVMLGPAVQPEVQVGQVLPPLLVAAPAGALLGWALTRATRAALALGVASLALALSLGHNIPFFPLGAAGSGTLAAIMGGVVAVAGVVFGVCRAWLESVQPAWERQGVR